MEALNFTKTDIFNNISVNTTIDSKHDIDIMRITHCVIASVGIIANITVVIVLINNRKLRRKTPNICIINQVRYLISRQMDSVINITRKRV